MQIAALPAVVPGLAFVRITCRSSSLVLTLRAAPHPSGRADGTLQTKGTIMSVSKFQLLAASIIATLALSACEQRDTSEKVGDTREQAAQDVAQVQQAAAEDVAKANDKLEAARTQAKADIANANADANSKINDASTAAMDAAADAQADVAAVQSDTITTQAQAAYDVAVAKADADQKIARERCDAMTTGDKGACGDQADAARDIAKTDAQRALDDAKVAANDAKR